MTREQAVDAIIGFLEDQAAARSGFSSMNHVLDDDSGKYTTEQGFTFDGRFPIAALRDFVEQRLGFAKELK